jgi:hypothetical protein
MSAPASNLAPFPLPYYMWKQSREVDIEIVFRECGEKLGPPLRHPFCEYLLLQMRFRYRGADKFSARPGRKQATATEDFDVHIPYLFS